MMSITREQLLRCLNVYRTPREVAAEYRQQTGNADMSDQDVLDELMDMLDQLLVVRKATPNGTVRFGVMPTVGMPATINWIGDRHAATVIAASPTGYHVTVREDTATRTDDNGMSDSQTYTFEPNPTGTERTFFRSKDGGYRSRGTTLSLGSRGHYHDYSRQLPDRYPTRTS